MHLGAVGYEQQYQIRAADGTILWQGGAIIGQEFLVLSTDAAAIPSASAVIVDGPASSFTRDTNLSTADADVVLVAGKAVVSAASVGFIGTCVEPIAIGKVGRVAGDGSMLSTRCTSGAIAVGDRIGGSASAGLVATIAGTTSGTVLGTCVKAAAQIGSSGIYTVGTYVHPN